MRQLRYEVSGTMYLADTNWNDIAPHALSGYMHISDVNLIPDDLAVHFEVVNFVFRAGGYEWDGVGRIYGYTDRFLNLDGPGDWEVSTGVIPGQIGWNWDAPYQLPAEMSWPGDAWQFGDEMFSRVASLNLNAVPGVPVPAAVWLFCSGLVGLILSASGRTVVAPRFLKPT